jgi:hypothetical protein
VVPLVDALLVCVLCGAGFGALTRWRTTAKKPWFVKTESPTNTVRVPLFTRVYIVRCWQERTRRDDATVMRYALTSLPPANVVVLQAPKRCYTLSMELTGMQRHSHKPSERLSRQPSEERASE